MIPRSLSSPPALRATTIPPSTVRSASPHPDVVAVWAREARDVVAAMRSDVDLLRTLLSAAPSAAALEAVADLAVCLHRLELAMTPAVSEPPPARRGRR